MAERLTIAVPFYDGLGYLRIAIESVLGQRQSDWRLIVCDDGEREQGAAELVASYGDARIAYHRNPRHLGIARNWNLCIDRAETELVTLLHADDRLFPNYADLMLGLAGRHPGAAALCCAASIIDADGAARFSLADAVKRLFVPRGKGPIPLQGEAALSSLMAGNFIMCPTLCFRRALIGERRFSEIWKQVLDLELTARLLIEGEMIVYSREVAYAYRRHAGGATAIQSESLLRFEEEFGLFELVAARAAEVGWTRAERVCRRMWIVRFHLLYRALRALLRLQPRRAPALLGYAAKRSRKRES
jgi:glycosyltransferase involved in cell wall biosynthesis